MSIIDSMFRRGYVKETDVSGWFKAHPEMLKMVTGEKVPAWVGSLAESEKYEMQDLSKYDNQVKLYKQLSWVHSAISTVAKYEAGIALHIYTLTGNDRDEVNNHPLIMRLLRPNPLMSRFELMQATFSYLKITGNAYWYLDRPNQNGEPTEIWNVASNRIYPDLDGKSFIKGYKYDAGNGVPIDLRTEDVVHFKAYNPDNPFIGLSSVEPIGIDAAADLKMSEHNYKFFGKNNGRLPGILAFADTIAQTEWEKIKRETNEQANNRNLMMLQSAGKGGIQWLMNTLAQKDMEFIAGRQFTKEEIYGIFAPGLSSILAVNATEANARTGLNTLANFAIYPDMCAMAEKITNDLLPIYGDNLVAEFDDVRLEDKQMELEEQKQYAVSHTIEEIRQKYYGDKPLGDERDVLLPVEITGKALDASVIKEPVKPEEPTIDNDEIPDVVKWKRKSLKAIKAGKSADVKFDTDEISLEERDAISDALKTAKTKEEVELAFSKPTQDKRLPNVDRLVDELSRANDLLEKVDK